MDVRRMRWLWRLGPAAALAVLVGVSISGCSMWSHGRPTSEPSGEPVSITLEPTLATNPIRTQHTIKASVKDADGNPVHSATCEWTLARTPGAVGDIVSVAQDPWKRALKVDNTFAISGLDRNGESAVTITSVNEGVTNIIVYCPDIKDPSRHKAYAVKNWLDAKWQFPPAATNKVGSPHKLATMVARASDGTPLEGYDVTWRVASGPAATFQESGSAEATTKTDDKGVATATLIQTQPEAGTNTIEISIVKPADPSRVCCPAPHGVVAKGSTTKTWVAPTIAIQKTCPASIRNGSTGDFSIVVSNTSQVQADDVVVRDTVPSGLEYVSSSPAGNAAGNVVTWNLGNLAAGQSQTVTMTARGTKIGPVTNEVVATTAEGLEAKASCSTTVIEPALAIDKTCPAEGVVGQPLTFSVTVKNTGSGQATNVLVVDKVAEGMRHASGGEEVQIRIGDLPPGGTVSESITLTPQRTGTFTNVVRVTGEGLSAEDTCDTVVRQPALKISKGGRATQVLGRNVTYTIIVSNPGDAAATNVVVTDTIPAGMSYVSSNPAGSPGTGTVSWNLGTLDAGAQRQIEVTLRGDRPGQLCDVVTAQSGQGLTDRAQACTEFQGVPGLLTELVDDPDPVEIGTTTVYTMTLTNQGNAPLTKLTIVATIPDGEEYVSHKAAAPTTGTPAGKIVTFSAYPQLNPKEKFSHTVTVRATGLAGQAESDVRFRIEVNGDQLTGPVLEEESTHLYR